MSNANPSLSRPALPSKATDQLPLFNVTILFANEYGNGSYQRIMGVQFMTRGTTYSVQDLYSEETVSYVASDFTPLMPLTMSAFYQPAANDRTVAPERTVQDVWASQGGIA